MKNKLKLGDARALLQLLEGENVASSRLSEGITAEMLTEHLLIVMSRGSRRTLRTDCPDDIRLWLYQQYHVDDLVHWIQSYEQPDSLSRAEQVRTFGNSKPETISENELMLLSKITTEIIHIIATI